MSSSLLSLLSAPSSASSATTAAHGLDSASSARIYDCTAARVGGSGPPSHQSAGVGTSSCRRATETRGQFWRFIGSMGDSKPQTSSMQMVAGSRILRTDEEKGSAFLQRFVSQCSRGDMTRRDEAIRDLSSRLPQLASPELFSMDDLTRAIERIGQVSSGPDRIPASALKNLSAQSKSRLLSEINESLVSGTVPTEWCDSRIGSERPIFRPDIWRQGPQLHWYAIGLNTARSAAMYFVANRLN